MNEPANARNADFQLSFGWSDQLICQHCGKPFVSVFLTHWFVAEYRTSHFYSVRFCSKECATNGYEKRDRDDKNRERDRKSWG